MSGGYIEADLIERSSPIVKYRNVAAISVAHLQKMLYFIIHICEIFITYNVIYIKSSFSIYVTITSPCSIWLFIIHCIHYLHNIAFIICFIFMFLNVQEDVVPADSLSRVTWCGQRLFFCVKTSDVSR
jgi:hypothetical protein